MSVVADNPLHSGESRRVLLVVDDSTLAELLVESLEDAGHFPVATDSIATARAALARHRFDAAIVDVDTRARDGAEVIAFIRAQSPSTTVIALVPCGGVRASSDIGQSHLAIEKPARLRAVLSALSVAHVVDGKGGGSC